MKLCVIGNKKRYQKFMPNPLPTENTSIVYFPNDANVEDIIKEAADANVLFADAIAPVHKELIEQMKELRLVQSEGVAYNNIDCNVCKERNIYVCNCQGINKSAVAEQTLLLMLGLLRTVILSDQAVRDGKQIERKEWLMIHGITELKGLKVGLIGFGDIAKETAKRLAAFDAQVFYTCRTRKEKAIEEEYHVTYQSMAELLSNCDMISLHVPVTEETIHMADQRFFEQMKEGSYFINTSRGELVENTALAMALESGKILGAALDTIAPEPVKQTNELLQLSKEASSKLLLSPHSAGITTATFMRGHKLMWENAKRIQQNERPENIVNDL